MAAKKVVSPLHNVIDDGQWDAERFRGRLIVLVHAAFLDAGFVPHPVLPVPREAAAGRAALSALPRWYTLPEALLHRQDEEAAATATLWLRVCGRNTIRLYVRCHAGSSVTWFWALVDAIDAAELLSGSLDATWRALRRVPRMAAIWRRISERLCRRALVDLCRVTGVALEPSFMSLPDDVKAAILARVADAADLARVERTCTALRRLVAERDGEVWKPRCDALRYGPEAGQTSWKDRYVRAKMRRLLACPRFRLLFLEDALARIQPGYNCGSIRLDDLLPKKPVKPPPVTEPSEYPPTLIRRRDDPRLPPKLPVRLVTDLRKEWAAAARGKHAAGRGLQGKRRQDTGGAMHAPSSRHR